MSNLHYKNVKMFNILLLTVNDSEIINAVECTTRRKPSLSRMKAQPDYYKTSALEEIWKFIIIITNKIIRRYREEKADI